MTYEEFLNLPINHITQYAQNIRYKRENNIPFSEEELELQKHFTKYSKEVKLQQDKARLEYLYTLDDFDK